MAGTNRSVKLISQDGIEFDVDVDLIRQSVVIKHMLDDLEGSDDAIPVPDVDGDILEKVIRFCEHHRDDAPLSDEERVEARRKPLEGFDAEFVRVDHPTLFKMILAANFLDIQSMLDTTCKATANLIKGKTPAQIRQIFNIEGDFTPEEEEEVRKENSWLIVDQ